MTEEKKFNAKFVLYIGFAFFTAELAWGLYNARVSLFLKDHLIFLGLVGIWMALDNIIGVILQPIMGSLSDNTRTKYGRRMPYLIVGIPLAAVFFSLIPFLRAELTSLLIIIFLFGIAMGSYRAQAVAIMPDFVRSEHRSKGNAIINAMGGVFKPDQFGTRMILMNDFRFIGIPGEIPTSFHNECRNGTILKRTGEIHPLHAAAHDPVKVSIVPLFEEAHLGQFF